MRNRAGRVIGLAVSILLIAVPAANAAARFTSPTGKGTACSEAAPCGIETAFEKASNNDDITIEPGTYGSPKPLQHALDDLDNTLTVHGQAGQPRPVIISEAEYAVELSTPNSTLKDVDIENLTGAYGVYVGNAQNLIAEDVVAHVSAPKAVACYASGTITDSICWSSGAEGIATTLLIYKSASATLRNDTLIASGSGGDAVLANAFGGTTMSLGLANTIARGSGADIVARTDSNSGSTATVTASNSNFALVHLENGGGGSTTNVPSAGTGTNQAGAPLFVNAAAGDFHEQAGSSATIDLGENSSLDAATDLDGNPRALPGHLTCGPAPAAITDIGAYEYVPVVPPCVPPRKIDTKIAKTKVERSTGTLTFTFRGAGAMVTRFECALQRPPVKGHKKRKPAFSRCKSPKTYKNLPPGRYRFRVRAVGPGGPDPTPAAKTVKIKPISR